MERIQRKEKNSYITNKNTEKEGGWDMYRVSNKGEKKKKAKKEEKREL